jgi:hypothetical protein
MGRTHWHVGCCFARSEYAMSDLGKLAIAAIGLGVFFLGAGLAIVG